LVRGEGESGGDILQGARLALTGSSVGLGLFDTLAILGKGESLARLDRLLTFHGGHCS
jgi:glutamyl/glutaminyl-tRNA synthetase